jgi:hypothetical protein
MENEHDHLEAAAASLEAHYNRYAGGQPSLAAEAPATEADPVDTGIVGDLLGIAEKVAITRGVNPFVIFGLQVLMRRLQKRGAA